jgi:peptidoglycan hydrolase CwlO-like protein
MLMILAMMEAVQTSTAPYTPGELLFIVSGICVAVTTMVTTIINAIRQGQTNSTLAAHGAQLDGQDTKLRDIKEQTNGASAALREKIEKLISEVTQLKAEKGIRDEMEANALIAAALAGERARSGAGPAQS